MTLRVRRIAPQDPYKLVGMSIPWRSRFAVTADRCAVGSVLGLQDEQHLLAVDSY